MGNIPSHAMPYKDGLVHLQGIQNADNILAQRFNTLLDKGIRRAPSAGVIKGYAAEPASNQLLAYSIVVVLRRAQTMHED